MIEIRYILIEKDGRGGSRTLVTEVKAETAIIGRGGKSQILVESHLVSLEHAALDASLERLQIRDLGSNSGLLVNGRKASSAELQRGDLVQLGDVIFEIDKDNSGWVILRTTGESGPSSDERLKQIVKNIEYSYNLPSGRVLSVLVITLVVIFGFIFPIDDQDFRLWTTGPLSTNHGMLQNKCTECHVKPFEAVSDRTCSKCHLLTEHAPLTTKLTDSRGMFADQRCAECHLEHNGSHGITSSDNRLCVTCHSSLTDDTVEDRVGNVKNVTNHPQFSVSITDNIKGDSSKQSTKRVSLDDANHLRDSSRIKLNHKVHLAKNLRGPDGVVTLNCDSCHQLGQDRTTMQAVTFDRSCRSCHTLGFDEQLAQRQVPHANADVVYTFLYAEYAKLSLSDKPIDSPKRSAERELPGRLVEDSQRVVELTRQKIVELARATESELFERTGCMLCHDIQRKSEQLSELDSSTDSQSSAFEVVATNVPKVWFPAATFKHGAHMEIRCESCHRGVSESTKTTDVLLPKIETCQSCHGDPGSFGKVDSNCIMCHSYHNSLLRKDETKRRIEEILQSANPASGRVANSNDKVH